MKLEIDLSEADLSPETIKHLSEKISPGLEAELKKVLEKRSYPDWMDLKTTCDYLQISHSNLAKFIKELDFPVTVINQTKRCNRNKVDEWMSQFER